ncbi:hypothetical protein HDU76_011672 [Blyttiomyces sp. JEL0837]|nr:hypothetical protein HDU76_011672 [Blyttiomyces sp. JEL0837]
MNVDTIVDRLQQENTALRAENQKLRILLEQNISRQSELLRNSLNAKRSPSTFTNTSTTSTSTPKPRSNYAPVGVGAKPVTSQTPLLATATSSGGTSNTGITIGTGIPLQMSAPSGVPPHSHSQAAGNGATKVSDWTGTLVDPQLAIVLQCLKLNLQKVSRALKSETQANTFNPQSATGKLVMAKMQALQLENERLGEQLYKGQKEQLYCVLTQVLNNAAKDRQNSTDMELTPFSVAEAVEEINKFQGPTSVASGSGVKIKQEVGEEESGQGRDDGKSKTMRLH